MSAYTKQQLDEQYQKLPDVLKDAIYSVEVAEKIFAVGKRHGLTIEKIGFLAEDTGSVILGLLPPREFVASLSRRLEMDADKAMAVATDINHQIFFPLRESLKETHHIEVGGDELRREVSLPGRRAAPAAPASVPQATPRATSQPAQKTASAGPAPMPDIKNPPVPAPTIRRETPRTAQTAPEVARLMPPSPVPVSPVQKQTPDARAIPASRMAPPLDLRAAPKPALPTNVASPAPVAVRQDAVPPPAPPRTPEKPAVSFPPQVQAPSAPKEPPRPAITPVRAPAAAPGTGPKKPPPIVLHPKFADDLEKEIAPLIGGISPSTLPGFITREETEKIVAEKLAQRESASAPATPDPRDKQAPQENTTSASTAKPEPAPPRAPEKPAAPPIPPPIVLTPLEGHIRAPEPAGGMPLGTAKVPPLDLRAAPKPPPVRRQYNGFDPYKEPVE